jgi:hypothetical protein
MLTSELRAPITDLVLFDDDPAWSHERVVIAMGASVQPGVVMAKITAGAAVVAAKIGNTGNGVLTMNAVSPILKNVTPGIYTLHCITVAVGGGTFRVNAPDGAVLGDVAVGAIFANQIDFSIAAGVADFALHDAFTITVARGNGKYVPLNVAGVGGAEVAVAVAYEAADATAADKRCVVLARGVIVDSAGLIWPAGATVDDIATGIDQLEKHSGILTRTAL